MKLIICLAIVCAAIGFSEVKLQIPWNDLKKNKFQIFLCSFSRHFQLSNAKNSKKN